MIALGTGLELEPSRCDRPGVRRDRWSFWLNGVRVNPIGAKVPQGTVLAGRELKRFKADKARIDGLLAASAGPALAKAGIERPKG